MKSFKVMPLFEISKQGFEFFELLRERFRR